MAAFPSIDYSYKSFEIPEDDREDERADDGTLRGRAFWSARKGGFELDFDELEAADKATLLAHYDAHRNAEFDFLWCDGATYSCAYPKDALGKIRPRPGGRFSFTMKLKVV